jgi:hypothetical protein
MVRKYVALSQSYRECRLQQRAFGASALGRQFWRPQKPGAVKVIRYVGGQPVQQRTSVRRQRRTAAARGALFDRSSRRRTMRATKYCVGT